LLNFEEAAGTFYDYTAYEREVLHLLASIRWACCLMATAVAGGAVPFVILALLGYWSPAAGRGPAFFVLVCFR
jgi:hypothetical protein